MIIKTKLTTIIILLVYLTGNNAFSQKLTREEVNSKLTRSWTATQTGKPDGELFPNKNKVIMEIRPDGSLTLEMYTEIMGSTTSEMLWGFSESEQKLITTTPQGGLGKSLEFEIIELTDNKLVLVSPEKQTVYIPTEIINQETGEKSNIVEGLNPGAWSGVLHYNIVVTMDKYQNTSEERVPGIITLEKIGKKKIVRKKELGNTVTWTINSTSYIANVTRYDAVCSDLNLNGDISFQNGFMLLEIYEPKYLSYWYAIK